MSLRCKERLAVLSDYLDGELDEALCTEIETHLAGCDDCRVLVDTLRKTIVLYREYGHEALPAETRVRLFKVLNLPATPLHSL
jgi:anti-sigma factor RsiW